MPRFGLHPVVSMAIGGLIGGASQFLVMMPSAYSAGFRYRFILDFSDPGLRRIVRLMLPAIIGLSATQINITVDSQIASAFGNGPMSWLNYGFRLMQFPMGVFGVAIATTSITTVSYYAAQGAKEKLNQTIASSLRFAACLTFPATIGLIIFRNEIVRLLYEGGAFLPVHTLQTSQTVMYYSLGLFSYSAVKILVPAFYALDDARIPVRVSMITVVAKIALNLALIIPLGFLGLALATSVASWLNCGLLLMNLQRKTGIRWRIGYLGSYVRIAAASVLMGGVSFMIFRLSGLLFSGFGGQAEGFRLGLAILAGIVSIIPLLRAFRIDEGREIYLFAGSLIRKIL
jgi:putative peptidoglycan lipid II flippase